MTYEFNPMGDGPVRLCRKTRELAKRYLQGDFAGRLVYAGNLIDGIAGWPEMDNQTRHAELSEKLAAVAPLEIVPDELLAGAAPYMDALEHRIPGWPDKGSISHTTVDFGDAVAKGRLEKLLRRAKRNTTGSRVGAVGNLKVLVPGPGGTMLTIDGSQYYADQYWDPAQYWTWQDSIWKDPPTGRVTVSPIEVVREADEAPPEP